VSGTGSTGTGTTGTSGSTGLGGPFVSYDGGPRSEPTIDYDAGCTALQPKYDIGTAACVECTTDSDCPTGLVCDPNSSAFQYRCVQCDKTSDCPTGQVCDVPLISTLFWVGTDTCGPDCRGNASICQPGYCESDSGVCFDNSQVLVFQALPAPVYACGASIVTGWCLSDSDCALDGGGGACIFSDTAFPFSFVNNGFGYCVQCKVDGGDSQCPLPGQFCDGRGCAQDGTGFPQDGPAGACMFNCFLDAGACVANTYCLDAGPVTLDDGGGYTAGACVAGCLNDSNCGGATPVCVDGGICAQCGQNADCPDWAPGCGASNLCNACAQDTDCPVTEKCMASGQCGCYSSSDCPTDVPVCVGGDDAGTVGTCACLDSSLCQASNVCETRSPYAIIGTSGSGAQVGGVCISACAANADCASSVVATAGTICDSTTGYCVACLLDSDCNGSADPAQLWVTPSCVLYPDAGNPNGSPAQVTGGGQCGCSDTSQCNGGYTCASPGYLGSCQPPCSFANGIDSCTPVKSHPSECNSGYSPPPFCNTQTGSCQQCLDNYDCTSLTCGQPLCVNGICLACLTGDDCQAYQSFPAYACQANACGPSCTDVSQCPSDGGYSCIAGPPNGGNACLSSCVLGDDAGLGTVSDAGNPCPASAPLCISNPYASDPTAGICSQCLSAGDSLNCDGGGCVNGGSQYCDGLTCTGACY
jgi:Cys-rich repeat protein